MKRLINALLFTALSCSAQAAPLSSYTAQYQVFVGGFDAGEQTQTLTVKRRHYQLTQAMKAGFAYFTLTTHSHSEGNYRDRWLPSAYQHDQKTLDKHKTLSLKFNHRAGRITSVHGKDSTSYGFKGWADDPLSLQLNLRTLLRHRRIRHDSYQVAEDKHLSTYAIDWQGTETVDTPWGPIKAIKLAHEDQKHAQTTTFWLAPSYQYLPIQILFKAKGMQIRAKIRMLKGFGQHLGAQAAP